MRLIAKIKVQTAQQQVTADRYHAYWQYAVVRKPEEVRQWIDEAI